MFSLKIVDSDAFLDMPPSTQLLYFHLSMRADDDGFVGNPKKITKMIGANDDDFKILLAKRFLLSFETGVVVVKHWKIHNYIQNDRYTETQYLEEKSGLITKENGSYTECIQDGYTLETQVRLGKSKVRLGKSNIAETSSAEWDFKEALKKLDDSPRRDLNIISLYWKNKDPKLTNRSQAEIELRRCLRPAKLLMPYEDDRLVDTMNWLKKNADFKWTLESVAKYITEDLSKLKTKRNG